MKLKIKKSIKTILIIIAAYFIINLLWSLINIQVCSVPPKEELFKFSCEEQAEIMARSCHYLFFKGREVKVDQGYIETCKLNK